MARNTTIQQAYASIHLRILSGAFQPGFVLSEAVLAKELGVSRTPVGEALRELAGLGLVEQVPRYGTIVRRISRDEIVELYELRAGLEPYTVALAVQRIGAEDIARLENCATGSRRWPPRRSSPGSKARRCAISWQPTWRSTPC